jgi:Rrf2 family protein
MMRVALGRKGDYAVRSTLELARWHGRGRRKAREIAAAMDIPERYLPQVLGLLVRHQLLLATAGPDGGYELARPPSLITLLEVVEAAEGPIESTTCLLRGGPCDWENLCPVHRPWHRAQGALVQQLRQTTFADLAAEEAAIEAGDVLHAGTRPHAEMPERRGVRSSGDGAITPSTG